MNWQAMLQYAAFFILVTVLVKPLGIYMAKVFERQRTFLDPVLNPLERCFYRFTGVNPSEEMDWKKYAYCFVLLGFAGTVVLYAVIRIQRFLPWFDGAHMTTPMTPDLAMNTAISFATTTTWQAYGGEITMSYFSQLAGLAVQNFLAGASGLSLGVAFIRGFARSQTTKLGSFWVDLVRSLLWILLPLSLVGALLLVSQGVIMNFRPYTTGSALQFHA